MESFTIPFIIKPIADDMKTKSMATMSKLGIRLANDLAFDFQTRMRRRMPQVFDRPTPAVIRAVQVDKATGNGPIYSATVSLKSNDAAFNARLQELGKLEEVGGTLTPQMLGRKVLSVPGYNSPLLNAFGGITRGAISRALSSGSYRGREIGIFTVDGKQGLWQRVGKGGHEIRLLALFEQSATYKPKLGWAETARATMADARTLAVLRVVRLNASKGADAGNDAISNDG